MEAPRGPQLGRGVGPNSTPQASVRFPKPEELGLQPQKTSSRTRLFKFGKFTTCHEKEGGPQKTETKWVSKDQRRRHGSLEGKRDVFTSSCERSGFQKEGNVGRRGLG